MKRAKAAITLIIVLFFVLIVPAFSSTSSERIKVEKIEELMLLERYSEAAAQCAEFLHAHKKSRYRERVEYLEGISKSKCGDSPRKAYDIHSRYPSAIVEGTIIPLDDVGRQSTSLYIVQVGVFSKNKNARSLESKLRKDGFDTDIIKMKDGSKTMYRVVAGKFRDINNAEKLLAKLKIKGYPAEIVNG